MSIEDKKISSLNRNDFLSIEEVELLLRSELEEKYNHELFLEVIKKFLIVTIIEGDKRYLCVQDVELCKKILQLNNKALSESEIGITCNGSFLTRKVRISKDTVLIYEISDSCKTVPAFIRNILYIETSEESERSLSTQYELLGITIVTTNKKVGQYIENALYRKHQLDRIKSSSFANSSSYMGTKRKLVGFIVEAMYPHCNIESVYLDLMCGSGAVSNALAQMGEVYASDAQEFCGLLAKIQGAGYNQNRASKIIKEIFEHYKENLVLLEKKFSKELQEEDDIFHMNIGEKEKMFNRYVSFIESYKLYSSTSICPDSVVEEIDIRKRENSKRPYCLFTYYYANVFFGVAQCIQLDSIRYAIDQLDDKEDREWALGVLIVVTSAVATTFGGHFAQPKRLDLAGVENFVVQRSKSAWLEFSKRMLTIASESERYMYAINVVKGPWEDALSYFKHDTKNLVVYLDAPYKREEYSRYYHVLETMAKYDYPESENKGRMRSKKKGERFSTEFFSKTEEKVEGVFEKVIGSILNMGASCVWSYSDNGIVSLKRIIAKITEKYDCEVFLYSIPHKHLVHGKTVRDGKARMSVIEYCVVFILK